MRGLSVVSISRVTPNTLSERDTESTALFLCVFKKPVKQINTYENNFLYFVCLFCFICDVNASDIYYGCYRVLLFAGFEKYNNGLNESYFACLDAFVHVSVFIQVCRKAKIDNGNEE